VRPGYQGSATWTWASRCLRRGISRPCRRMRGGWWSDTKRLGGLLQKTIDTTLHEFSFSKRLL
jgi:hypothetical protein